jgi:hypothetical protein
MEISRSRIVQGLFVALFAVIGVAAAYRSNVIPLDEPSPWADAALAAPRGEEAARKDLKAGLRKIALFGLITNPEPTASKLRELGYALESGGCLIGGNQYEYWRAYNRVMIEAGRTQFGERFVTVLQDSLT